jgi:Ni/Co efflux regulator RcnB
MKKFIAAAVSFTILAAPMMLISESVSAKTVTQKRMEDRSKAYKQKSAAKTAARKASR